MVTSRLLIDRDACVGAGMCVMAAPEVFDQDELDGRVLMIGSVDEFNTELVREAVMLCPSGALSLSDD